MQTSEVEQLVVGVLVPALGSISLGSVVGWLTRAFIRRFETFTAQTLTAVVSIVSGGSLSGLALKYLDSDSRLAFAYFIGLPIGFIWYRRDALLALQWARQGPMHVDWTTIAPEPPSTDGEAGSESTPADPSGAGSGPDAASDPRSSDEGKKAKKSPGQKARKKEPPRARRSGIVVAPGVAGLPGRIMRGSPPLIVGGHGLSTQIIPDPTRILIHTPLESGDVLDPTMAILYPRRPYGPEALSPARHRHESPARGADATTPQGTTPVTLGKETQGVTGAEPRGPSS